MITKCVIKGPVTFHVELNMNSDNTLNFIATYYQNFEHIDSYVSFFKSYIPYCDNLIYMLFFACLTCKCHSCLDLDPESKEWIKIGDVQYRIKINRIKSIKNV